MSLQPHTKSSVEYVPACEDVTSSADQNPDISTGKSDTNFSSPEWFYNMAEMYVKIYKHLTAEGLDVFEVDDWVRNDPSILSKMERVPILQPSNSREQFVHEPLSEPNMIRLLLLHKGQQSDPLEGSIRHECLGPAINYRPISYAWENSDMPCSMLLNGKRMFLTRSLHNALCCMRRHDSDLIVWADGICINQTDNVEKSIQVSLMPKVFDQARVWVYLGPEADDSNLIPQLLEDLSNIDYEELSEPSLIANNLSMDDVGLKRWRALFAFLNRPWFKRLWVVQEVVVARDIRFCCGDWEIRWRRLPHAAELVNRIGKLAHRFDTDMRRQSQSACQAAAALGIMLGLRQTRSWTSERLTDLEDRIVGKRKILENLSKDCVQKRDLVVAACIENPKIFSWVERGVTIVPSATVPGRMSFFKLFTSFMFNETSHPQDRLYALVGLAGDVSLKDFPPSYTETVQEANMRMCKVLIEKELGMDVLYHATNLTKQASAFTPSWTVDWTTRRTFDTHWLKLGWAYRTKNGFDNRKSAGSRVLLVNDHTLRVWGHKLDGCQSPVVVCPEFSHKDWEADRPKLDFFLERSAVVFSGEEYFTGEAWPLVQYITLTANAEAYQPENVALRFTDEVSKALDEDKLGDLQHTMLKWRMKQEMKWLFSVVRTMSGYAICKTSKGYVGVVPGDTTATDEIFMLEGSEMPFVLRPIVDRPSHYNFVGGCYIHGLMDGEAWKPSHENAKILLV